MKTFLALGSIDMFGAGVTQNLWNCHKAIDDDLSGGNKIFRNLGTLLDSCRWIYMHEFWGLQRTFSLSLQVKGIVREARHILEVGLVGLGYLKKLVKPW